MFLLRVRYTRHTATQKKNSLIKEKNSDKKTKKTKCAGIKQRKGRKNILMMNLQLIIIRRRSDLSLF